MIRKNFYILLVIIASAGLLLRLQVCSELLENDAQVSHPSAYTDMATYKDLSEKIARGEFQGNFYYQPFYYAVFLPVVHKIMGDGIWPVMIAQALISALTIFLAAISSAMLWGRMAGVVTALLTAFSAVLILYVPYHLIETLQAFWITAILYAAIIAWRRGRIFYWGILGFLVSLSILTRGNVWFCVPGLVLAAFFSVRIKSEARPSWNLNNIMARLLPVIVFLVMVILPQLPFAARNTKATGKLCGPSTAAGAVLALGNTPEAPPGGRNPGTGPGPMEYPETYGAWMDKEKEIPVSSRMFQWFKAEPLAFIELQCRKMLLFWDRHEIPNNIAFERQGMKSRTFRLLAFIPTAIIMAMALGWLMYYFVSNARSGFKRISRHPEPLVLFYLITSLFLATAAFYILARFRLPIVPLMSVGAGGLAATLFINLARRNWKKVMNRALLPFLAATFIVVFGYDFYRYYYEPAVMKVVRPDGIRSEIREGRILYMDNGPLSFGSWMPVGIKEGDSIRKKFVIRDSMDRRTVELSIPFLCDVPGKMKIEINGKPLQLELRQGMDEKLFQIQFSASDPQVEIKFLFIDCKAYPIFDFQRNYGRTEFNGKNPCAELVSKLYLVPQKEPKE